MTLSEDKISKGGPKGSPFSRVVLVGGGHAHLELIRSAAEFRRCGIELHLVDPGDFHYSGGASAVLGGSIAPGDNRIELQQFCAGAGVSYHSARAISVDRDRGRVRLDTGIALAFDQLSLDIGSCCRRPGFALPPGTVEAKPIAGLEAFQARLKEAATHLPQRVLVVGGGATGVELAGNLLRLSADLPHPLAVTLVSSRPSLLSRAPAKAGHIAARRLGNRNADIRLGDPLVGFAGDHAARLFSGHIVSFDHLVLATGLEASTEIEGLPAGSDAGFAVDATLSTPGDRRIFAVGDCASIEGHDLPKLGVYSVRAAPILKQNLIAGATGRMVRSFRPQARALAILDLGDETGLAIYGRLVLQGHLMLWWKRRIDRRFLDRYRAT